MEAEREDRMANIFAKLDGMKADRVEQNKFESSSEQKPPKTYEEYVKLYGLKEWPERLTSEGPLHLQEEGGFLGGQEDIYNLLKEEAPIDMTLLDDLEDRLLDLERKLRHYADQIITEETRSSRRAENLFYAPPKAFLTQMAESDAVKIHHSSKAKKSKKLLAMKFATWKPGDLAEVMLETRKKGVEFCTFPGFRKGELTELPAQLETPQILHRVTKAQDFNRGFKKMWKKVFLSEASVALMQDTFWWFFINKYEKSKHSSEQDQLFDRIADSFVALFSSIHPDVKDKFFQVYPEALAQAIYSAFLEAFPESKVQFHDGFKQELLNTTYEWMTGVKPVPGTHKQWNLRRLEPKAKATDDNARMLKADQEKNAKAKSDMENFEKYVMSFGNEPRDQDASRESTSNKTRDLVSREITKATRETTGSLPTHTQNMLTQSRVATCGTPRRKPVESHQIGPGPEFERVKFNLTGQSPLIAHYMHMRQLQDLEQPGRRIRRTEIAHLPLPAPTYKQVINKSLAFSQAIQREYQRITEQTNQEILKLELKRLETNREISKMKDQVSAARNSMELKMLREKLWEKKMERQTHTPLPLGMENPFSGGDDEDEDDTDGAI
ncbi:protein FAM227B isoform X1 [Lingula anatina]|uniref:Protein FAM227B isoform X1 n=1 Tax=Lingula anatina TaxID=7574 RepID=A0A1S3HV88_LINAN|nr:protein FAM227B isoform X1 [Lingula anatina]|eukprot:XP_013389957.1 protein FAM227B isoform X1 [Lingula anatina]